MPDTARDLIKQTISNTPGTAGSLTLSTASTGYLALGASDDGKTFTVLISASDSDTAAKEMRSGCTYTHSATTLTRGTLVAGTAIDLTSSAVVSVVMQADSGRRWDAAALEHSTVTGTSGAITAAVNTLYVADMSGWTADRTLTLPATAAVGDRVGVMVSTGDDAYEWLITANTGDTLNGVAGGTEWSRVYATGDCVVFRCVTANSAWVVDVNAFSNVEGFSAYGDNTTQVTLTAGGTTVVSSAAKTVDGDRRGEFNTTTGVWFPTRPGIYVVGASAIVTGGGTAFGDGNTLAVYIEHSTDGSTWTGGTKRCLAWRGISGSAGGISIGGSGSYAVEANGTTDRFRVTCYYSGASTDVKCPGGVTNRDWVRFSAFRIGGAL